MCVCVCICAPGITVPEPKPRFIIFTAFAISHCLTIFWAAARRREGILPAGGIRGRKNNGRCII